MMKGLIMNKPKDPVDFLVNCLQSQEGKNRLNVLYLNNDLTTVSFLVNSQTSCVGGTPRQQKKGNRPQFGRVPV